MERRVDMSIIITGASGLIGKEITKQFINKGAEVVCCDIVNGCDLTNEKFVKKFFKKYNKESVLINLFALNDHVDGEKKSSNLFDVSLKSFNDYLQVNLTALFSVCREFARTREHGNIINFSSTYGVVSPYKEMYEKGREKHIAYCVSKSGILQLTKYLATHLAPNFKVNCVVPGGVKHEQSQEFVDKYSEKTLLNRMMDKHELFGIVEFLSSPKSSYATGATFTIDGGWTAR